VPTFTLPNKCAETRAYQQKHGSNFEHKCGERRIDIWFARNLVDCLWVYARSWRQLRRRRQKIDNSAKKWL
jgi:hypothetical protein